MMTIITTLLRNNFTKLLIPILAFIIYFYGYNSGYSSCKNEWDAYIKVNQEERLKVREQYLAERQVLIEHNNRLAQEIVTNEQYYKDSINSLNAAHIDQLRESDKRADYYRSLSKDRRCTEPVLADYTARFDKQLTEGISVVSELRELVKLRDEQLRQCGKQMKLILREQK